MLRSQDQRGTQTTLLVLVSSLTVTGLGLVSLIRFGLVVSILCSSSVMTSDCVLLILVSGHYEYFNSS